jgi:hypothetical protein
LRAKLRTAVAFLAILGAFTLVALIPLLAVPIAIFFLGATYGVRRCSNALKSLELAIEVRDNARRLGDEAELDKGWAHYIAYLEKKVSANQASNAVLRAEADRLQDELLDISAARRTAAH